VIFNEHSGVLGHAFLSASKYHWINYDEDKLADSFRNAMAARRGTELHALAHSLIQLGVKLPRSTKTLNAYVNDAIGFRMQTEQVLFYSENCYGTCDAITYTKDVLRIHDLKTGVISGSMHQLEIYAALFCLEYAFKPGQLEIELRIYQNDEVEIVNPDIDVIAHIMSKIIVFDQQITNLRLKG
jgi:Protein of unknown function (DUF2800)